MDRGAANRKSFGSEQSFDGLRINRTCRRGSVKESRGIVRLRRTIPRDSLTLPLRQVLFILSPSKDCSEPKDFRFAAPRSIQPRRWRRLTPPPTLLAPLVG